MKNRKSKNALPVNAVLPAASPTTVSAVAEWRRKHQGPVIERVESVPAVTILIKRPDGSDIGLIGGNSRPMAEALEDASKTDGSFVLKREDSIFVGQDIFETDRDYLFSVCGLMLKRTEVVDLHNMVPEDAKITFVVSY